MYALNSSLQPTHTHARREVRVDLLTGKQLGPYRVVAPLGAGGMASVYKAYQPGVDRYVALKILPQHLASDPQFVARFQSEATIIANLQHPHILPVFDFGAAEGYTYLVMPLIASGTLAQSLRGQPLPFDQIRHIIAQVGDALDYAHSRGIVHRDVKPSNVLLDPRGNCLLADFGIAKIVAGAVPLTITGSILGTPAYMSPEQSLGTKIDTRSDIYALGVVLYELATGRVPFTAETPMGVVLKQIHAPLPPPRTLNPALPERLERTILKALAKNPDDRFQTAADLVRAVNATAWDRPLPEAHAGGPNALASETQPFAATGETVAAPTHDVGKPPPTRPRTGSSWVLVGGISALLLALVGLGGTVLRMSARQGTSVATGSAVATAARATEATRLAVRPTPETQATPSPLPTAEPTWIAIGGTWTGPADGAVHGETDVVDALYMYSDTYSDFTFAAEVQAVDREASLAFRMQDAQNGYLVIIVPSNAIGANPGIYLAKRVRGEHSFLASTQQGLPTAGQWVRVAVQTAGANIQVSVNDALIFDVDDTTAPQFAAGQVGFRIYGDQSGPCQANFRAIQLPA
jgi:hypothetical protein